MHFPICMQAKYRLCMLSFCYLLRNRVLKLRYAYREDNRTLPGRDQRSISSKETSLILIQVKENFSCFKSVFLFSL